MSGQRRPNFNDFNLNLVWRRYDVSSTPSAKLQCVGTFSVLLTYDIAQCRTMSQHIAQNRPLSRNVGRRKSNHHHHHHPYCTDIGVNIGVTSVQYRWWWWWPTSHRRRTYFGIIQYGIILFQHYCISLCNVSTEYFCHFHHDITGGAAAEGIRHIQRCSCHLLGAFSP